MTILDPISDVWLASCDELAALSSWEQLLPVLQSVVRRLGLPGEPGLFLLDEQRGISNFLSPRG